MIRKSLNQNISVESIPQTQEEEDSNDENYAVRGTRTLHDVYNKCNAATLNPITADQALQNGKQP